MKSYGLRLQNLILLMIGLMISNFIAYGCLKKFINNANRLSGSTIMVPEQAYVDFTDFQNNQYQQSKEKLDYQLRSEQRAAIQQTLIYAKNNPQGEFLWNAKPRFGKTLTTYDFARELDAKKVLIVTNRPAIANSWFDD